MESKKRGLGITTGFLLFSILMISFVSADLSDFFSSITGRVTSQNVGLNISIAGTPPNITMVIINAAPSITENGVTLIMLNFTVHDIDGFANINGSNARAEFNKSLETTRRNSTGCVGTSNFSTDYANFTCTIGVNYFDASGNWQVNTSIGDMSGTNVNNHTVLFNLGQTSAFVTSPSNLTFATLTRGTSNQTASNNPLLLNNTGNKNITTGGIHINATDLRGDTNAAYGIWAGNFSIGFTTGSNAECDVSLGLNNATIPDRTNWTILNHTKLLVGNHSVNDGTTGQEQLYFCVRTIGSEIISQAYTTNVSYGPWTIRIV